MANIDLATIAAGDGSQGFVLKGETATDNSGWSVSSAGDVNGDGFDDLIVGAIFASPAPGRGGAGESYVVFGKAGGLSATINLADITNGVLAGGVSQGFVLQGEHAGDLSGFSVASAGDVNGDGFDDLIVGAAYADGPADGRPYAGDSYVIFGKATPFTATIDLATITTGDGSQGFVLQGELQNDYSGWSVSSAGDVNGDGFDDVIVGAYKADGPADGRDRAGDSYVIFGKAGGFAATIDLATITTGDGSQGFVLQGESGGDTSGWSVSSAGDVNGDGFDDLIVGAPQADGPADGQFSAGDSYVVFGKAGGFAATIDLATITAGDGSQGFVLQGELTGDDGDSSGWSVSSAGDVNGDGFDDLIVGAFRADGPADGRNLAGDSYVIFGKAGGFTATIDLATITGGDGSQGFVLQGVGSYDYAGRSVSSAGDVNGDGFDDLMVGASRAYINDVGASYVIFGSATIGGSTSQLTQAAGGDGAQTLTGSAAIDILDGGRGDDTLVGNGGADVLRGGEGDDTLSIASATFRRIDGGNGDDVLQVTGTTSLVDSDFRRVEHIESIALGNDQVSLTLGRNAQHAIDGLTSLGFRVTVNGTAVTNNLVTINGSALTHPLFADLSNDAATVTLTGGSGADHFTGGAGDDVLTGGTGIDVQIGGLGEDSFFVAPGDVMAGEVYDGGGNTDELYVQNGSVDFTGTTLTSLEELGFGAAVATSATFTSSQIGAGLLSNTLAVEGDGNRNTITVNMMGTSLDLSAWTFTNWTPGAANDKVVINGTAGDDTIRGTSQYDELNGGGGNDFYYVANAADTVNEAAGGGTDRVFASASYTLKAGQEIEKLTTDNNVGTAAINLTGNERADTIFGNNGANTLDGKAGIDSLTGLGGDDFYYVDNALDVVNEAAGGGNDRVFASVSYTLRAGQEIEKLSTTSNGGTGAINLTGNERADVIFGNNGANTLDGKAGADNLNGLGGDDFYYVDNALDVVNEAVGAGNDRVFASVSYTLKAGQEIEKLTTDSNGGTGAINLTGNELANIIFGNNGANTLDGKAGADDLNGLGGDDFYYVDNALDKVNEAVGAGNDRVFASASYTLKAGQEIEKLTTDSNGGTGAINLTGNERADVIFGNAGANVLNGKDGNDTLIGLGGADTFVFDTALSNATNLDVITDMTGGVDHIKLALSVFTALSGSSGGTLAASEFVASAAPAAADSNDHILYNTATGLLDYDSNGNMAGGVTHIARLTSHPTLANTDFLLG